MDSFSWSDAARAVFGPCLQCLPSRKPTNDDEDQHQSLGRWDELEGLLQNPGFSDGEMDADALSLHSNVGQPGPRRKHKKRRKAKGRIRLFGYDLFGRPLHWDEDDGGGNKSDAQRRISRLSSSSLDSDAAPLTEDIIPRLSADQQAREDFEAARKSRKEHRKKKKLANLFVPSHAEFDGVPGSGPALDEYGAFQTAPPPNMPSERYMASPHPTPDQEFIQVPRNGGDEADASADFDAVAYTRGGSRRSDSGSGTRSRTSASASNTTSQGVPIQPHLVPLPPSSAGSSSGRRKKSKSGKRSTTTGSTDTSSQPRSPTAHTPPPHVGIVSPTLGGHPAEEPEFEGDDVVSNSRLPYKLTGQTVHGDTVLGFASPRGFPSSGFSRGDVFPSSGFSGRKNSISMSGAFLARTGDDS